MRYLPSGVKEFPKHLIAEVRIRRAIHRIKRGDRTAETITSLFQGWNNAGFAAEPGLLQRITRFRGPVLECGSGASTILLAAMGVHVTALEHHPVWYEKVRAALERFHLSADLRFAPLRDYGEFDWYELPPLPWGYHEVICDGPPGETRGGRYGLLPVAHHLLADDCVILLDDMVRQSEQEIAERWFREYGCAITTTNEMFAELSMPIGHLAASLHR